MKKLILYSVSALALCGGVAMGTKMMAPTPNSLMMRNIEALSEEEAVEIPCLEETDSVCRFLGRLADGKMGEIKFADMKHK